MQYEVAYEMFTDYKSYVEHMLMSKLVYQLIITLFLPLHMLMYASQSINITKGSQLATVHAANESPKLFDSQKSEVLNNAAHATTQTQNVALGLA